MPLLDSKITKWRGIGLLVDHLHISLSPEKFKNTDTAKITGGATGFAANRPPDRVQGFAVGFAISGATPSSR